MESGLNPVNEFLNSPLSMRKVEKTADKLKNKKAKGGDSTPLISEDRHDGAATPEVATQPHLERGPT